MINHNMKEATKIKQIQLYNKIEQTLSPLRSEFINKCMKGASANQNDGGCLNRQFRICLKISISENN